MCDPNVCIYGQTNPGDTPILPIVKEEVQELPIEVEDMEANDAGHPFVEEAGEVMDTTSLSQRPALHGTRRNCRHFLISKVRNMLPTSVLIAMDSELMIVATSDMKSDAAMGMESIEGCDQAMQVMEIGHCQGWYGSNGMG